jgi:ATP-dependent helicase HepA
MLSVIQVDREHDIAYIRVQTDSAAEHNAIAQSVRVGEDLVLDLDRNGKLIGIELLHASARLDLSRIADGTADLIVGVKEAATLVGTEKSNFIRDHANQKEFPKPIAELASGRFWLRSDVEGYAQQQSRASNKPPLFHVGDLVAPRSDPATTFPIIEVVLGSAEPRYRVFENNTKALYYESQLIPAATPADERPIVTAKQLQAHLTSLRILAPSTANLYSLGTGRVQFVPYQYRPVLKLIRADQPRILIADEVGVGKTIEAGLILRELRARMELSSVLIICPKALVAERKWFTEMKRFDEQFTALDGPLLRQCLEETDLEGEWPQQYAKAILPFSLFDSQLLVGTNGEKAKKTQSLLNLNPPPRFDLVIVDEAHHIRNTETYLHQGVRYFCDNAQAVLLLTATPVQLGSDDLFTLLNVVRPDLVIDHASFHQMAAPNRYINEAIQHCRLAQPKWEDHCIEALAQAVRTEWGRLFLKGTPTFRRVEEELQTTQHNAASRVALTRSLEELYTFSPLINRTRRRDIGVFTTRKPETITIPFTASQQQLHDDLLNVIARILIRTHGAQNIKFMMTTIRRQAASCLYGLTPFLADLLNGKLDRLELMEATDDDNDAPITVTGQLRQDIEALLQRSQQLDPQDPKVDAFVTVLRDKSKRSNNKALVFSTFRHTLSYLEKHAQGASLRVGLIHGSIPDDERRTLRQRFKLAKDQPDALDVLLSSEVGCEGLDFQFCDLLINYDLPWNPMRIEQRIGRIDRYGQESETIAIVNLITPGTVDADIYERCLVRIGVFQHAVGGNEEILGTITRELHSIADTFQLTSEERILRLQQLADNSIRRIHEEQRLEDSEAALLGLAIPTKQWREEIKAFETFWLSPAAIHGSVATYLASRLGTEAEHILGEKPMKTLRLNQEARRVLLADYRNLPRSSEPVAREWEKWLKGSQPTLTVTFDQNAATEHPNATHFSVLHPLVRQAARFMELTEPKYCALAVINSDLPAGRHSFALYRWTKTGIRPDEELIPVTTSPALEQSLLRLLETATEASTTVLPEAEECDEIDSQHHRKWAAAQASYQQDNQRLAEHRIQSLNISHQARCKVIEEQIARATNEKIRLMKESELARANADYNTRLAQLQTAAKSGDIRATPLTIGTVTVSAR